MYHKKVPDQSYLYLLLYGDDMLIAAKEMAEKLLDNMKSRKKYTHLDVPKTSAITRGLVDVKRKRKEEKKR